MIRLNKLSKAKKTTTPVQTATSTRPSIDGPVNAIGANSIPNTPNRGEKTGVKTATVGDEVYKEPVSVAPNTPAKSIEYLPGSDGKKYPIGVGGPKGPTMPLLYDPNDPLFKQTPEQIAESKAKFETKKSLNPGAVAPTRSQQEAQMQQLSLAQARQRSSPMMGSPVGMKKGGSVRGAGIAQRGVKKCKVY